jgi:PAS domain S-box-containing protein
MTSADSKQLEMDAALKIVMDASPIAILVLDKDAVVIYANALAEALFGKSVKTSGILMCGDFIDCLHCHRDLSECGQTEHCPTCPFYNAVRATLNSKQDAAFIQGQIMLERAAGRSPLHVKYKAGKLMVHGHCATVLAIDEISVREGGFKENENKYRWIAENGVESSATYRLIFEYSPMGLLYFDSNGVILACNDNFVKIIGSSKEKLIGLDMLGLPDTGIVTAVRKALEGGTGFYEDVYHSVTAEKNTPVRAIFTSMTLKDDGSRGGVGIIEDITERWQAEQALKQSEEKYRKIYENSLVGIFRSTPEGRFIEVNPSFARMLGYESPDDLISTITDIGTQYFVNPKDRERYQQILHKKGYAEHFEFEVKAKEGSRVWVSNSSRAHVDHDGKIRHYEGIVIDITERKRAEEALRESEMRFSKAFRSTPAPLVISDIESGCFIDVNDQWVKMLGYSREEQIGRTSKAVGIWADPNERDRIVQLLQDNGFFKDEPIVFKSKIGEHIHALWSAEAVTLAGRSVMLSMISDETVRRQAQAALQQSAAQFRSLLEGAPDAVFVQNDSCFVYVNDAAVRLFGARSAGQLLGTPVLDRYHPDYHQEIRERIRLLHHEKQKIPRRERICLRLDGTSVPVEVSAVPVVFEGQDRSLVFVQDISERKQIEIRLQQAQKMEAIGTLAGGIAHDFNNILFPIMGLSEMLLEDLAPGSLERANVAEIYTAGRRAGDLVNQILSFSRQMEHKKTPIRVQQILREVIKLTRATIPSNIAIHKNIQTDCGPILADPTNVHQIAMNLITNAFHAVEEGGGSIGIELAQIEVDQRNADGAALTPGAYALLTVSDTGHGIAAEVLPRIFDPYFTTKPQGKGTGLGLSVVFGIVKEHGGDLRVHSEVGRGTVFKVYLPLLQSAAAAGPSAAAVVYPTGSERILLVDDEEPILRLEKQMLERLGYHVSTRTSSVDALAAFQVNPDAYDLVITDMAMPNMTGDQLARRMLAVRADIPVILCTGFSDKMTATKAKSLGIKGFLKKPLVRGDLAGTVRKVLDEASAKSPG